MGVTGGSRGLVEALRARLGVATISAGAKDETAAQRKEVLSQACVPQREREAVAPMGGAPHTVCCPHLSAAQAALVQAGIASRSGRPRRQKE
jgi:hypothetical protein